MSIVNLQSEPIYVRSPFFIEVNQPNIFGSRVEITIWNDGTTQPTSPTYTLDKLIPSPTSAQMLYNISNYAREFLSFASSNISSSSAPTPLPDSEWCFVEVKRYKLILTGYTLLDTKTYYAFDGYGYFEQGYNPELGLVRTPPGKYNYWFDADNPGTIIPQPYLYRYGEIAVLPTLDFEVIYTSLGDGTQQSFTFDAGVFSNGEPRKFFAVHPIYSAVGNVVEYKNASGTVIATWTFTPKTECKYTPVVCDFVNQFGAWQRTIFYKVSKTNISTTKKEFNLLAQELVNYDTSIGQTKVFNLNAKESIKVNTDWVKEEYNEIILKPLMLSEVIRIDGKPATLKTSKTELFEHINQKQINYELEFTLAYATINNMI